MRVPIVPILLVASALLGAGATSPAAPRVEVIRLPEGGLQPQLAVDTAGAAHLVYFKGDPAHGDVFYTRVRRDGSFDPPAQVNTVSGSVLATGTVRGGHVALGADGCVHVAWMGSSETHGPGASAPVLYTRSNANRRGFEAQRNVMTIPAIGPDGASIAADPQGHVYIVWHALPAGGKGEADRRLFVAASSDSGRTFVPERVISDPSIGACGCCGTGAFAARDGTVYALFRAARQNVHRDTSLLTSTNHGESFASQSLHAWDINACPMSTYAFAEDAASHRIAAAWETAGRIYWTNVAGTRARSIGVVQAGGDLQNQKHPAVAVNARGETLVAWTEGTGWNKGGAAAWQVFDSDAHAIGGRGDAAGVPVWGLVSAFARADGTFWIVY